MISVENLWKTFKAGRKRGFFMAKSNENLVHAVAGVSFTCTSGRVFTLLGPNGAGKTTALRLIATLIKPTSGSISVSGYDARTQRQEVKKRIGFLTGTTKLYERLTPNELVRYYADLHGMDKVRFHKRRDELFTLLGIHEFAHRRIGKLSSGMKQKVSIARTVIHDPEVIVFDEPTVGLDVITARHILDLIRNSKEAGKTVLFSTHIMGEVSLLSDDLAIIHEGKLCFSGTYEEFRHGMQTRTVEEEFIRLVGEERS